jgi:hypothetical protein
MYAALCNHRNNSHLDNHLSQRSNEGAPAAGAWALLSNSPLAELVRDIEVLGVHMSNRSSKLLLLVGILLLTPLFSFGAPRADHHEKGCDNDRRSSNCAQVPEGGSSSIYLLGASLTCLGAIFVRSRLSKSNQA